MKKLVLILSGILLLTLANGVNAAVVSGATINGSTVTGENTLV